MNTFKTFPLKCLNIVIIINLNSCSRKHNKFYRKYILLNLMTRRLFKSSDKPLLSIKFVKALKICIKYSSLDNKENKTQRITCDFFPMEMQKKRLFMILIKDQNFLLCLF